MPSISIQEIATAQRYACQWLLLLFFFQLLFCLQAQGNHTPEAERLIQLFADDYTTKGPKSEKQLNAFIAVSDPGMTFELTMVALSGNKKFYTGNVADWIQFLRRMHAEGSAEVVRSLKKIELLHQRPNTIYATVCVEFAQLINTKPVVKGDEYLHVLLRKVDEFQWRIINVHILMIETEKFRGMCLCELFNSKGTSNISAKITIPAGATYRSVSVTFQMEECDPKQKTLLIRITNFEFIWLATGQVYLLKDGTPCKLNGANAELIGVAIEQKDLFSLIIKKYLFESECSQITFK
ncbi:MAG: hypothetical protein RMJ44_03645 [Cytophagales bacterium]|nr:hypothetical protein [Bernardetiaceae bacterium]MDW8210158.1 hypothetical protein [Cytophagales bacterium]